MLALLGIGLIAWYCMKKSRKAHQQNRDTGSLDNLQPGMQQDVRAHYGSHDASYSPGQYERSEFYKPGVESPPSEMPGWTPAEMHSEHGRAEAGEGQVVRELPGDVPVDGGEKPHVR